MTKVKDAFLKTVTKVGKSTAERACGATSYFLCCQPKEPAMLKKTVKK